MLTGSQTKEFSLYECGIILKNLIAIKPDVTLIYKLYDPNYYNAVPTVV